jgi:hypothetical protein
MDYYQFLNIVNIVASVRACLPSTGGGRPSMAPPYRKLFPAAGWFWDENGDTPVLAICARVSPVSRTNAPLGIAG